MMAPKRASLLACATDAWACLAPADARGDFVARLNPVNYGTLLAGGAARPDLWAGPLRRGANEIAESGRLRPSGAAS